MTEKEKMELLLKSIRGISDGHVSPEDAIHLCDLLIVALGALRQHTHKYWAKLVLDSATIVLKDISENIKENNL